MRRPSLLLPAAILLLGFAPTAPAQAPEALSIDYTLRITDPVLHLYQIEMTISGLRGSTLDVAMPAWAPGVYAIRDHARNVQQFEALGDRDRPLPFEKIDKQTWRLSKSATEDVTVRYRVYSTTLNDEMADLSPAATFMYVVGRTQAPLRVRFEIPDNWEVHTGLEERSGRFHAANYGMLVESPVFIGTFRVIDFKPANGIPHRVVFSNPRIQLTELQVIADLEDLSAASAALFGAAPYRSYTFLVRVQPASGAGAIGYVNSSRIVVGENDFVNQSGYTGFLIAAAQGFAQAWLGKRIRPAFSAGPDRYDYTRESYSRLLWFTEGVSAYTADLLLLRAKIATPPEYYNRVSNEIRTLQEQPGRLLMSLEEASWNVWGRADNSPDVAISHLLKGKIAGLLLDLEIRGRTQGKRSLDDVLRLLLATHGAKDIGLSPEALTQAVQTATGIDPRDFFEHVVRGHNDLDYNRYLAAAGLMVSSNRAPGNIQIGVEFERIDGNQARVRRVLPGSAAAAARLDGGDILVAIDTERVTFDNLTARIHSKRVGRPVTLSVLRGDRLVYLSLTPREVQGTTWSFGDIPAVSPDTSRIRQEWLDQP
jgi:predicted metalloprotease with PDZ domain